MVIGRGNRTSPCLTLERLEKARVLERFVGAGQQGHKGLGSRPRKIYRKVDSRKDIVTRMKSEAEEKRLIILHQYELQASWLSWGLNEMMKYDFSWNSLLYSYTDRLLKFVLNAQTNTLPTPDNLRRWGLKRNVACGLCGKQEVTSPMSSEAVIGFVNLRISYFGKIALPGAIITFSTNCI